MSSNDLPTGPVSIGVLVVDDHPLLRAGLVDTLQAEPGMHVAGEADDGSAAVQQFIACRPDITIMDIAMPRMDGVEALRAIRAHDPAARVIMLTTFQLHAQIRRAVDAGAQGLLLKSGMRADLVDVIRAVHAGERWFAPEIAQELAKHMHQRALTEREIAVLRCAALGNSNKRIAQQLEIAEETVKAHMRSILAKLDARDRTHAATIALQRGIITL